MSDPEPKLRSIITDTSLLRELAVLAREYDVMINVTVSPYETSSEVNPRDPNDP